MDMVALLEGLTVWHWLGIAIVLLTLEVAVGTFDLLWVAIGAFATAVFALFVPGWQAQLTFFGLVAIAFVVSGRTVFKGLRNRQNETHPNLNDRLASMIGATGHAATNFDQGEGKVKVGDTVWLAHQSDNTVIVEGDQIVVSGAESGTLKVRLA